MTDKPDAADRLVGRGERGKAGSLIFDDDLDRLGIDVHAHAERTRLAVVGVHHDVVAGLADRGLQVVEQLGIEPDQLGYAREHSSHERQRLGPRVELEANGR